MDNYKVSIIVIQKKSLRNRPNEATYFYDQLNATINKYRNSTLLYFAGDFNV